MNGPKYNLILIPECKCVLGSMARELGCGWNHDY